MRTTEFEQLVLSNIRSKRPNPWWWQIHIKFGFQVSLRQPNTPYCKIQYDTMARFEVPIPNDYVIMTMGERSGQFDFYYHCSVMPDDASTTNLRDLYERYIIINALS